MHSNKHEGDDGQILRNIIYIKMIKDKEKQK